MTEGSDRSAIRTDGVFDPDTGTFGPGVVIVDGGRVEDVRVDVPPGIDVRIEHPGLAVPGFVDAHSHATVRPGEGNQLEQLGADRTVAAIRAANNLRRDLEAGTTTMRLMGEEGYLDARLAELEREGELLAPRLLPSGIHLTPTGGHGQVHTATDGTEAIRKRIRKNVEEGATHTKFFATGGVSSDTGEIGQSLYSRAEVRTIVEESRRHDIHVAAHAHAGDGARIAVEEGVDTIEHGSLLEDDIIRELSDSDQFVVGTFSISGHPEGIRKGEADNPEILAKLDDVVERQSETWQKIIDAGCHVALGTDSMHGKLPYEIRAFADLGLPLAEALKAVTIDAARCVRMDTEVGSIKPGKRADLLLVDGNPLDDLSVLAEPAGVIKDAKLVT